MQTLVTKVPADRIFDWDSFHAVFADCLEFPGYYGANMDAWIDCLTYADDAQAGMVGRPVAKGALLTLQIDEAASFAKRCPAQYAAAGGGRTTARSRPAHGRVVLRSASDPLWTLADCPMLHR